MQALRWDDIPREKLSNTVERQVVWGERATLARFFLGKGTYVARHSHESEQFTSVLAGAVKLDVGGKEVVVRPGETLVIPAWVEHEAWALEDTEVLDFFAPPRDDWRAGQHQYLQGK